MNRIEAIAKNLKEKESKQGLLSFGNGIKNVLGVRHTNQNIRLRIINNHLVDKTIYLSPEMLLGVKAFSDGSTVSLTDLGLPAGIPFFEASTFDTETTPNELKISALNPGQNLTVLGTALSNEPTQISAISMKSFTGANVPENTNYGNSLTHYKLSHLKEVKRSNPLNFDAFQSSKDVSTEILKIDLIKNNFAAPISQNDVLAFQVNAGTRMDITLHLGARLNQSEYFYRQIKAGSEVLRSEFPNESAVDGCEC